MRKKTKWRERKRGNGRKTGRKGDNSLARENAGTTKKTKTGDWGVGSENVKAVV